MKQKRTRIDRNIDIDEHGKYHISLYYGYENGKYKRKSVTCSTKEEAINIRDKHECDVRFYGKASTNTKITVAECIEQYIEEKPLEETTKGGYRTRRGSGFKKICEDYAFAEGYTEKKTPRFNSDNDNFTLILPNLNYNGKNARSRKGPEKVQKQGPETVDRKSAILQLIASNPKISRAKISAQLGLTDKQVRITLDQLVADKRIKHDGPDRGGQWIIL